MKDIKYPETDTETLQEVIYTKLKERLEKPIKEYLAKKQKLYGDNSLEYQEYLDEIINKEDPSKRFFQNIYTYPIRSDITIFPISKDNLYAKEKNEKKGHPEILYGPWDLEKEIWLLPELQSLINKIIEKSENWRCGKKLMKDEYIQITPLLNVEFNQTPKCLVALELERTPKTKYILGSAFSASFIGKVGILAYNSSIEQQITPLYETIRKHNKGTNKILENLIFIKDIELLSAIGYYDQ